MMQQNIPFLKRSVGSADLAASVLGVFAFSLVFALSLVTPTHATSIYDNAYLKTNTLIVQSDDTSPSYYNPTCSAVDITTTWETYITDTTKWHSQTQANIDQKTSYQNALVNGSVSVGQVYQQLQPGHGRTFTRVTWSETFLNAQLLYNDYGSFLGVASYGMNVRYVDIGISQPVYGNGDCTIVAGSPSGAGDGNGNLISANRPIDFSIASLGYRAFFTTFPPVFPANYEGIIPNTTPTPPRVDTTSTPRIKITGAFNNFSAKYDGTDYVPATSAIPEPSALFWSVIDLDDACQPGDTRPGCTFAALGFLDVCSSQVVSIGEAYDYGTGCNSFIFDQSHHYAVTAGYTYGLGWSDAVPGYHIIYKTAMYTVDFTQSNYNLSTTTCTTTQPSGDYGIGQQCTGPAPVDCSTVSDIPAKFVCYTDKAIGINSKGFGLTSIVSAPLSFFHRLEISDTNYICTALILPLPYVNSNITLPCMTPIYQSMMGGFFTLYQTLISGVISYWVVVGYLNTMKELKDPKNDKIYVSDL